MSRHCWDNAPCLLCGQYIRCINIMHVPYDWLIISISYCGLSSNVTAICLLTKTIWVALSRWNETEAGQKWWRRITRFLFFVCKSGAISFCVGVSAGQMCDKKEHCKVLMIHKSLTNQLIAKVKQRNHFENGRFPHLLITYRFLASAVCNVSS